MSLFNRKYKKVMARIKSLEEHLGLYYVSPEDKDDYPYHGNKEYGELTNLDEILKAVERSKKDD